jgi:uncharacterized protein (DUF362 family)
MTRDDSPTTNRGPCRRAVLTRALIAAGWLAAPRRPGAWAAEAGSAAPAIPDRSGDAPTAPVAVRRCEAYEPKSIRGQLDAAFDALGGIGALVRGKTVTVKLNLTGCIQDVAGLPAHRTYLVHPAVVAALCAALRDAGARRIVLVEGFYSLDEPEKYLGGAGWDIGTIRSAGGQTVAFENTRNRGAFPSYARLKVPWGGFLYPAFDVHARYEKTDVFVSLAKMKDHSQAGVTLSVKNLFGITPQALYGGDAPNENSLRARIESFHFGIKRLPAGVPASHDLKPVAGDPVWKRRVPRVAADVLRARPVDLAVIDAVETVSHGEGPWVGELRPTRPRLLVAGRNAVCTDAVCAALMGYDPEAPHGASPFQGENHLRLLASAGAGANALRRIEVLGIPIDRARSPFRLPPKEGEKSGRATDGLREGGREARGGAAGRPPRHAMGPPAWRPRA